MSRTESVNRILRDLRSGTPGVEACALVSEDGLMIAGALPEHIDETRIAGITATLSSLGMQAGEELGRGDVEQVLVRGKSGFAVVVRASDNTLLLVLAGPAAKLGLVSDDTQRSAQQISNIL